MSSLHLLCSPALANLGNNSAHQNMHQSFHATACPADVHCSILVHACKRHFSLSLIDMQAQRQALAAQFRAATEAIYADLQSRRCVLWTCALHVICIDTSCCNEHDLGEACMMSCLSLVNCLDHQCVCTTSALCLGQFNSHTGQCNQWIELHAFTWLLLVLPAHNRSCQC